MSECKKSLFLLSRSNEGADWTCLVSFGVSTHHRKPSYKIALEKKTNEKKTKLFLEPNKIVSSFSIVSAAKLSIRTATSIELRPVKITCPLKRRSWVEFNGRSISILCYYKQIIRKHELDACRSTPAVTIYSPMSSIVRVDLDGPRTCL